MFYKCTTKNNVYISWGRPPSFNNENGIQYEPLFSVNICNKQYVKSNESVLSIINGNPNLGVGDSIWLINFLRDFYFIKGHGRCKMHLYISEPYKDFFKSLLPKTFSITPKEYIDINEFNSIDHKLPSLYYWPDKNKCDKTWLANCSILERMYKWTNMQYKGIQNFSDFTPEEILYPNDSFYSRLDINKKDKYIFFQWRSSGKPKNLPIKTNIKILHHLSKKYGIKVYIIGIDEGINSIEKIPGVINLSTKTSRLDMISLAFNSEFIVCPDSAGLHLGEAYRKPSVGILSTLPPNYIAKTYKMPTFIFGSGECEYKPCGAFSKLPSFCPNIKNQYCKVLEDIDLKLLDKAIEKTFENRLNYRYIDGEYFYNALNEPISL